MALIPAAGAVAGAIAAANMVHNANYIANQVEGTYRLVNGGYQLAKQNNPFNTDRSGNSRVGYVGKRPLKRGGGELPPTPVKKRINQSTGESTESGTQTQMANGRKGRPAARRSSFSSKRRSRTATSKQSRKKYKKSKKGYTIVRYDAIQDRGQGGIATSSRVGVLGHTSIPVINARIVLWCAVLKKLFQKTGFSPTSLDQILPVLGTDIIELTWQEQEGTSPSGSAASITTIGASTIAGLASYFADATRTWNLENKDANKRSYLRMLFRYPAATPNGYLAPCGVNLQGAKLVLHGKSILKLQNRTVESAGDDEVDVNSMPLDCIVFTGVGQGPLWRKEAAANNSFLASSSTSLIATEDLGLNRGVHKYEFDRVKKEQKLVMTPGQIRISTVQSKHTKEFAAMMNSFMPNSAGAKANFGIGNYKMYQYERTMDCLIAPLPVTMGYDLQYTLKGKFTEGKAKQVTTLYGTQTISNL